MAIGEQGDFPILRKGELFRDYEIVELVGRGGMGEVYKARQPSLDRFVALKILPPASDAELEARFEREAKSLAALSHPNIVPIHDFGRDGEVRFLVMELVEGSTLRGRKLAKPEFLSVFRQVCDALEFAHGRGIIHRDIKPDNILIDGRGLVRVADFGLAKMAGATDNLTKSSSGVGTPGYVAPEQFLNARAADARGDVYSLAAMAYEMLTGRLPQQEFEPTGLGRRVDEALGRALAFDPSSRTATVREFRAALSASLESGRISPWVWALPGLWVAIIIAAAVAFFGPRWSARPNAPPPPSGILYRTRGAIQADSDLLSIAIHPRRPILVAADGGPTIRRWNLLTREAMPALRHEGRALEVAFSADGGLLASAGPEGIQLWDGEGNALRRFASGDEGTRCVAISPDGRRIASGGADNLVHLWQASGEKIMTFRGHQRTPLHLAWSPDGRAIASVDAGRVLKVWTVVGAEESRTICENVEVSALSFAPDGRTLVLVGAPVLDSRGTLGEHTVCRWSTQDWKEIPTSWVVPNVRTLAFRRDNRAMAVAWPGRAVRLLDPNGGPLAVFDDFAAEVDHLAFSADGRHLVAVDANRNIRTWESAD